MMIRFVQSESEDHRGRMTVSQEMRNEVIKEEKAEKKRSKCDSVKF
jgi:hypothetical protein